MVFWIPLFFSRFGDLVDVILRDTSVPVTVEVSVHGWLYVYKLNRYSLPYTRKVQVTWFVLLLPKVEGLQHGY